MKNIANRMERAITIAMVGGDSRELEITRCAVAAGASVRIYGVPGLVTGTPGTSVATSAVHAARQAHVLLLPLPGMRGHDVYAPDWPQPIVIDDDVLGGLDHDGLVITGTASEPFRAQVAGRGLRLEEYEHDRAGRVDRAAAVAEGAIARIVQETDFTINRAHIALVGYGIVGSQLAARLHAFGARVHVFTRDSEAQALARVAGHSVSDVLTANCLANTDLLINTAPALVIDGAFVKAIPIRCILVDMASPPGGIEHQAVLDAGYKLVWLRGLSATSPTTVGRSQWTIISEIIERHFPGALRQPSHGAAPVSACSDPLPPCP